MTMRAHNSNFNHVKLNYVYIQVDMHACANHFTQGFLVLPLN
jgi:hypothetical protein